MGNKNAEQFAWEDQYRILEKNFNDGTLVVQKEGTDREYLAREIACSDQQEAAEIKKLVQLKSNNNNPFVTKLLKVESSQDPLYCSSGEKIYMLFEKPRQTLKEEMLARKFAGQIFSEEEADVILQSGIKAIKYLKEIGHPHGNISTASVFIDTNRQVILGDPWLFPCSSLQEANQNSSACPSPQKILFQNDQIMTICPYKADLFSLGAVILQILNYEHMDVLYEKGFRRLVESRVQDKLQKVKNQSLRFKLSILLSHDPKNRDQIYRQYKNPSLTVSQMKNRAINKIVEGAKQKQVKNTPIHGLGATSTTYRPYENCQSSFQQVPSYNAGRPPVQFGSGPNYSNTHQGFSSQMGQYNRPYNPPVPQSYYNSSTSYQSTWKYGNNSHYNGTNYQPSTTNWNSTLPITTASNLPIKSNQPIETYSNQPQKSEIDQSVSKKELEEGEQKSKKSMKGESNDQSHSLEKEETFMVNNSSNISHSSGHSQNRQQEEHDSSVSSLKHTGNYNIKNHSNFSGSSGSIHDKTPVESLDFESKDEASYGEKRKTLSENSDKGFLEAVNEAENSKSVPEVKYTPNRRPKKKYNSTIQEVDENEDSDQGEQNQQTETIVVEEQYNAGRYEGQKKNGMRNGRGKFYYNEGSIYEGQWKNNHMHGQGILYYSNGNIAYEGQWREDEFHGLGKVYNEDQKILTQNYNYRDLSEFDEYWISYEGELNSDRRHGKGKIKLSNGEIFMGNFFQDTVEGKGKFFTNTGQVIEGVWKNNILVSEV